MVIILAPSILIPTLPHTQELKIRIFKIVGNHLQQLSPIQHT